VKEPNVVQCLLQAVFTAVSRHGTVHSSRELRARTSRALVQVSSSRNTRRRQRGVRQVGSRGPRRPNNKNSRKIILVQ